MKWEDIKKLIGRHVKEVREFKIGHFDEGFLLFFDDGTVLTAQDGEYGDNAFRIVPIDKARGFKVYKGRVAGLL